VLSAAERLLYNGTQRETATQGGNRSMKTTTNSASRHFQSRTEPRSLRWIWVGLASGLSLGLIGCGGGETVPQPPVVETTSKPPGPVMVTPQTMPSTVAPVGPSATTPAPATTVIAEPPPLPTYLPPPLPAEWALQKSLETTAPLLSLAISPSQDLVLTGSPNLIRGWKLSTWEPLPAWDTVEGTVSVLACDPAGTFVAAAINDLKSSTSEVRVWKAADRSLSGSYPEPLGQISALAFDADGTRLALGGGDGLIQIWKMSDSAPTLKLKGHRSYISSLAFLPPGKSLISGSGDQVVAVWDPTQGQPPRTIPGAQKWIGCVAASPDGKWFAAGGGEQAIRLWDAAKLQLQTEWNGLGTYDPNQLYNSVTCLAFSPNSKLAASGSGDRTVRVVSVPDGKLVTVLKQHEDYVNAIAFTPDGQSLVSVGNDKVLRVWAVPREWQ